MKKRESKRIIRIITRMCGGGPANQIEVLKDLEDTLTITGSCSEDEVDVGYKLAGSKHIYIPELQRKINFKKDLIAFYDIYKTMREFKPDIVHTHTSKAGLLGRLAAVLYQLVDWRKIKVFHTMHGNIYTQYFNFVLTYFILLIDCFLMFITDCLIVLSEQQRQEILDKKICKRRKTKIIELGLDLDKFYKEK